MRKYTITDYKDSYKPAYVANGLIGLRVGSNPLLECTGLLNGFAGIHEIHAVEAIAPVPCVLINVMLDGCSVERYPSSYKMLEQTYDFSNGELTTTFEFTNPAGKKLTGKNVILAARSSPSMILSETSITVSEPANIRVCALLDATTLPVNEILHVVPKHDCDGVIQIEGRGGISTAGIAFALEGPGNTVDYTWGYEKEKITKNLSVDAVPGETYVYRLMTSFIPSTLHNEPHWQAVRMIKLASWKGFDKLRQENSKLWEQLWKSRIVVESDNPYWQEVIDASFFYLHSTVHSASPLSMAPFGMSLRDAYKGHVFWDTECFMYNLPLFTAPNVAKSMLEYRFDRIGAARNNAKINGYEGIQYPWQSMMYGDEVTRVSAGGAGGAGEQHVNMDVAMAFVAYVQVTGDMVFMREQAWPVVKGVADWIVSRVEKTDRGYEILFVTGIDEENDNVNNDGFTNIICQMVLDFANKWQVQLGYPKNEVWADICENMFISVNKELNYIEQFEDCNITDRMNSGHLMALFPYFYNKNKELTDGTIKFFIEHDLYYFLTYPMLSGFLGVLPAWLGDRELSRKFFDKGNLTFFLEPFMQCSESGLESKHYKLNPSLVQSIFLTGRGSLMTGLLMGLTRMNIWKDNFEDWFEGPIVLPQGWDRLTLECVYLKGKPAKVTAVHGAERAQVEWL